jgi:hypothetical protein
MANDEHLQGVGSYTYDCKKHDCEYCRAMVVINRDIPVAEQVESRTVDTPYKTKKPNKKVINPTRRASVQGQCM